MNLDNITTKGWILALFIRDDGERFLLGDGWYDFKDSLQHFQPNTFANDIVELQGTDGQLLAGQVRRSASQAFDGYVGDATVSKTEIEKRRRDFLMFFRKKHFYKVIYIFCDGSAIQRDRGYIVDAPSVPEMWQKFPSYHVALAFEQVNYYEYAEDEDGKEIFAHMAQISVSTIMSGGLVWDEYGAVSEDVGWSGPIELSGSTITINDAIEDAPMTVKKIEGNATQTSDGNIFTGDYAQFTNTGGSGSTYDYFKLPDDGVYTITLTSKGAVTGSSTTYFGFTSTGGSTTEPRAWAWQSSSSATGAGQVFTITNVKSGVNMNFVSMYSKGSTNLGWFKSNFDIKIEKSSTPAPNNNVPIKTVSGTQTLTVLGKNLLDIDSLATTGITVSSGVATGTASSFNTAYGDGTSGIALPAQQVAITISAYTDGNSSTTGNGLGFTIWYKDGTRENYQTWANSTTTATQKTIVSNSGKTPDKFCFVYSSAGANTWHVENFQIELGSAVTDYEAFHGQKTTIALHGKNLFNGDLEDGLINGSTGADMANSNFTRCKGFISVEPQTDYVFSSPDYSGTWYIYEYKADGIYNLSSNKTASNGHFITDAGSYLVRFRLAEHNNSAKIQLELGSIATTFEAFYDYELAKIDSYQDYIWKDGDDWKIHKEIDKANLAPMSWSYNSTAGHLRFYTSDLASNILKPSANTDLANVISSSFVTDTFAHVFSNTTDNTLSVPPSGDLVVYASSYTTTSAFTTAINGSVIYYALATATDTIITDATLISQLETVSQLYGGENNISLVPTSGAVGTLTIEYMSQQSATQGYVWESGGTGGLTNVDVSSVDAVQPIWTIEGPATNPTLTNITSSQSLSWLGTVPSGQTLTIDIANQTATMAGANVYAFLSGDWVELRPGVNRISYAVTGTDQPSTLSWNNIVG